jgi:hypothetical protein
LRIAFVGEERTKQENYDRRGYLDTRGGQRQRPRSGRERAFAQGADQRQPTENRNDHRPISDPMIMDVDDRKAGDE